MSETFEQLDELLAGLGASVGRSWTRRTDGLSGRVAHRARAM